MSNRFALLPIMLLSCCLAFTGCLGGAAKTETQTAAKPVETTEPPKIAELHLSAPKAAYAADEPIPLEMQIQIGKFDLLVPYATVESRGAFTKLVVKNQAGEMVVPQRPIAFSSPTKTLVKNGQEVRCIQGVDLKAGNVKTAKLDDLRLHYNLTPGNYTLQASMELKVYRESLADQSPQILELEREIASVQSNTKLPADAKQEAIARLKEEMEFIQSSVEEKSTDIYLPLNSFRGSAELQSNVVQLTIQ